MSKKRRSFTGEQKFQIVIEAIKGDRQISEIAAQYQVHPNQISNWKAQFFERGASIFSSNTDTTKKELEQTQDELFKKIGQQQYEIEWLKKNWNLVQSWRKER